MMDYALLLASVLLNALSQVLQKLAAQRMVVVRGQGSVIKANHGNSGKHAGRSGNLLWFKETWFALLSLACSLLLWLIVLQRMDVSKAFPVVSLSLVLVMLVSHFYFKEQVSIRRWLGAGVIALGVCLVAGS